MDFVIPEAIVYRNKRMWRAILISIRQNEISSMFKRGMNPQIFVPIINIPYIRYLNKNGLITNHFGMNCLFESRDDIAQLAVNCNMEYLSAAKMIYKFMGDLVIVYVRHKQYVLRTYNFLNPDTLRIVRRAFRKKNVLIWREFIRRLKSRLPYAVVS